MQSSNALGDMTNIYIGKNYYLYNAPYEHSEKENEVSSINYVGHNILFSQSALGSIADRTS